MSDGVYKRKKFTPSEGIRSLKFEELSDVDIAHAVPRQLHSLAFTRDKWVAFADPVQQTGWVIDLKITSPYVMTGKEHKLRKVVNSGTRLCSSIPETRNIIVSKTPDQSYVLKTGNGKWGSLKMVSEFPPAGIIGLDYLCRRSFLRSFLEIDLTTSLMSYPASSSGGHKNQRVGIRVNVQETPQVLFTLEDIQGEADLHLLNLDKLFIGPVSLKSLRFTPCELSFDQTAVIICE